MHHMTCNREIQKSLYGPTLKPEFGTDPSWSPVVLFDRDNLPTQHLYKEEELLKLVINKRLENMDTMNGFHVIAFI